MTTTPELARLSTDNIALEAVDSDDAFEAESQTDTSVAGMTLPQKKRFTHSPLN